MTEHLILRRPLLAESFRWLATMRTEQHGARPVFQQCCQTARELPLCILLEQMEDRVCVDEADAAFERVERRRVAFGDCRAEREKFVVEDVASQELYFASVRRSEQLLAQLEPVCERKVSISVSAEDDLTVAQIAPDDVLNGISVSDRLPEVGPDYARFSGT